MRIVVTSFEIYLSILKAVVRLPNKLPAEIRNNPHLSLVQANLLDLDATQMYRLTEDCDAVASCLGHNVSWRGIFGPPYRLVTEATHRLSEALKSHKKEEPSQFVLMSSAGVRNRDLHEKISLGQRLIIGLLRLLIPPHTDNERAADILRVNVSKNNEILTWCIVRPDTLTDVLENTGYEVFQSPIRSAIFDPGTTSRLNVARFMVDLITDQTLWNCWRGQMPVVYDRSQMS
jgi:hypothetical protein